MVQPPPAAAARRAPGRARKRPAAAPRHPRWTSPPPDRASRRPCDVAPADQPLPLPAVPSLQPARRCLRAVASIAIPPPAGHYRCPSRVTTSIANPMTTAAGTNHQVCSAVTGAAHQAASCSRALTALRPACPARAGSGSSPRPPHHGAQLGDLVHAERDHPALVGSVRPHPDEQTRRAVIAGVLPHRDVARDPLVTDWLARLALPVRAVIIQLWSLAVLDQLRLVRSRRLVFAGHDGVRAMCAPAQQSCEADGSPRRSVCRVTPNSAHHERSTVPRRTVTRGDWAERHPCAWDS